MTHKVLQLSRWVGVSRGGGIQTYIENLARSVNPFGVQLSYAGLMPGEIPSYAQGRVWLGQNNMPKWRNAFHLWRWLQHELVDVDLVHIHGVTDWHFFVAAAACKRLGVPYVVSVHGGLMPAALAQIKIPRFFLKLGMETVLRYLLRGAERVITTSSLEDASIRALDSAIKSCSIYPGVESRPIAVEMLSGVRPRQNLRLVYLGRVEPMKSMSTLIEAVAILKQNGHRVYLEIIGQDSGPYAVELKEQAESLLVADRMCWHGYQGGEEKWGFLQDADLLILPSLAESFGFAAAEAMSVGTPVIVSDKVGLATWIQQYDTGSVFPVGDAEALSRAILQYRDEPFWMRKAVNARDCAKTVFSLETMGEAVCDMYRDAVSYRGVCRNSH